MPSLLLRVRVPCARPGRLAPVITAVLGIFLFTSGCTRLSGVTPSANASPEAVKKAVEFVDAAQKAGLHYEWRIPGKRPLNILQTIGNGCGFLDYDNDNNLDILLVGSKLALYKGDGKGGFTDVSRAVGLDKLSGHFLGCATGDIDNDGYSDLYISGYRTGLLLKNRAGRVFEDITKAAGLKPQPWGTSCAFAETVPGSGRLDLYVANYAAFGPKTQPQLCPENGTMTSCGPRHYNPLPGVLYRNLGQARFADATKAAGATVAGKTLGVAFADYNDSGLPGLALANDEMPGDLLEPARSGKGVRYKNVGEISGTAYDRDGNIHGGMGIDWGDYDNDGKLDLFVTTFQNEAKSLYHNEGEGRFSDLGFPTGIGAVTSPYVAFGCKFFDYDNDTWLDLVIANGHVQDNITQIQPNVTYRQTSQLLRNKGGNPIVFDDVSAASGKDLTRPIIGRGLAIGDYDNDGWMDILIVDSEGKPLLLHNEGGGRAEHWLGLRLKGTKSNRDGYGAIVTAVIGGRKLTRQCQSGGSYLSASDPRIHFGIGSAARVDTLTVRWPSGHTDTYSNVAANQYVTLQEGSKASL